MVDKMSNKQYLGDGVYADYDGYMLILTTEDGENILNTIYLEPEVYVALVRYVEYLRQKNMRGELNND